MTVPNGHADSFTNDAQPPFSFGAFPVPGIQRFSPERLTTLVSELEVPFDPGVVEWRTIKISKGDGPLRGQMIPYADQRTYTDRLNALLTPAGWTRKYSVHTSANFERSKDQKIVAKVLVTCELTIFGLGSHSATGEEWADGDHATTSAEAQSFKRAASCFGLGRYFYYFSGIWVDLDQRRRPKRVPKLPEWATPAGWQKGLRPPTAIDSQSSKDRSSDNAHRYSRRAGDVSSPDESAITSIQQWEARLGKRMYRGVLKAVARVWSPKEIQTTALQRKVLDHMQAAEQGFRRLKAALDKGDSKSLAKVLRALKLSSLDQVDSLETLDTIVSAIEKASA